MFVTVTQIFQNVARRYNRESEMHFADILDLNARGLANASFRSAAVRISNISCSNRAAS